MQPLDLNIALCRALGIEPQGVESVVLTLRADEWPAVVITRHLSAGDVEPVREVCETLLLTPMPVPDGSATATEDVPRPNPEH